MSWLMRGADCPNAQARHHPFLPRVMRNTGDVLALAAGRNIRDALMQAAILGFDRAFGDFVDAQPGLVNECRREIGLHPVNLDGGF